MTGDSSRPGGADVPVVESLRGLSPAERLRRVAAGRGLSAAECAALAAGGLGIDDADRLIENVVGLHALPLGVALHLVVNGRRRLVPMAIEEPSVVAGLSNAAKMLAAGGGVESTASAPLMISQVQLMDVPDPEAAARVVLDARVALLAACDAADPALVGAGGGARDVQVRRLDPAGPGDPLGPMLVVHLVVDVREAMGANAVNTMAERVAPELERLTGGRACLRILTNLADRRTVAARGRVPLGALARGGFAGEDVARGIEAASVFAERDPYRAATHNKGIFNGIDALLLATGQDWRAVEAGGHAFAARGGRYGPLSVWRVRAGMLEGELTMPMAVGLIGGAVRAHAGVRAALGILGAAGAADLAEVAAAVGLAQNLAALRALASEGIQAGHMRLHRRKG
ncbi:MAG: hydroxymethylglutaryl-CoA reductase, degradative [Deltaproteobacteria bacterium]|nr:hydroxymethylglutaryl-CoA reductase, degradative [Deltaproteobacteria bacterium]